MLGNSRTLPREYAVLEQLTDSILVVDVDSNILLVNKAALSKWCYQLDQLVGKSISSLVNYPESRTEFAVRQWVGQTVHLQIRQGNGISRKVVMSVSKLVIDGLCQYLLAVKYCYPTELPTDSVISPYHRKLLDCGTLDVLQHKSCPPDVAELPLAADLCCAIQQHQLQLYYQPQVSVSTGKICGVEALCRWFHNDYGMIAPDKFIALAESVGIITELDFWVLRRACQQLAQWRRQGVNVPAVAINLSSVNLTMENLPELILEVLLENGLSTDDIVVEITESGFVEKDFAVKSVINRLFACGIKLSVDDFGVGYSNLSRLQHLPAMQLKLDRSLIEHIDTNPVAKSVSEAALLIGKSMQLQVVAEGVESAAQCEILEDLGFHVIQGYFFAAPLSVEQLEQWLAKQ
ncbi:EAL domain-containing protein [Shewanella sp. A3A]|nr:EAL domain-containing protein [Shewanella ferrihydritica]